MDVQRMSDSEEEEGVDDGVNEGSRFCSKAPT